MKSVVCGVPLWSFAIAICTFVGGCILFYSTKGKNKGRMLSARLFLLVYVVLLLSATVFFRETNTKLSYKPEPFWHYDVIRQGSKTLSPELIMNVLAFIPIGFSFCLAFRRIRWWQAALTGMGLSVGIELLQWVFKRGCADIDDVIHNTIGCLMGCCLYLAVSRCRKRSKGIQ